MEADGGAGLPEGCVDASGVSPAPASSLGAELGACVLGAVLDGAILGVEFGTVFGWDLLVLYAAVADAGAAAVPGARAGALCTLCLVPPLRRRIAFLVPTKAPILLCAAC